MDVVKRQGLPFKPGVPIEQQMADGLVDPQELAAQQPIPSSALEETLSDQQEEALAAIKKMNAPPKLVLPPEAEKPVEEAPKQPEAPARCARCGLSHGQKYPPAPTPDEILEFVHATLDTTGTERFTKSYPIFGGRARVTFRALTLHESEDIASQLRWERAHGKIDLMMLTLQGNRLGLAMSLARLETFKDGLCVHKQEYPLPADAKCEAPADVGDTVCAKLHWHLFGRKDSTPSAALYNALYRRYVEFDVLNESLTAHAFDPDFYPADRPAT